MKGIRMIAAALSALLLTVAGRPVCAQSDLAPRPVVLGEVDSVQIGAGRSMVIEAPWPVVRVSITQPEIADVQVLTPRQLLLTGGTTGTTDLILWGENDLVWHSMVSVVVDLMYIRSELRRIFPEAKLEVTQSQDMIVLSGQVRRAEEVEELHELMGGFGVKYVDTTSVAGVHQVMLRVRMAEMSREAIRALGVNFALGGRDFFGAQTVGSDAGGALNPVSITPGPGSLVSGSPAIERINDLPGNVPFVFGETDVSSGITLLAGFPRADLIFFLKALAENQYVRILAEPTLIALSGETASFLAGGEFPIPVVQGSAGGTGTSITIEYKEFGVRLSFTPLVLGDGTIRLHVAPEVSELSDFGAVVIEGFQIPSVLSRRAETTLELKSGQTFTIAGLMSRSSSARNSRVPVLGDLPILGPLFRSVRYTNNETELVVLVTASLVEPSFAVGKTPAPGDLHITPNDWEFYIEGRLEGRRPALAPADAAWMAELGLDELKGPGAWVTYEQPSIMLTPTERALDDVEPAPPDPTVEAEAMPAEPELPKQ